MATSQSGHLPLPDGWSTRSLYGTVGRLTSFVVYEHHVD